VKASRRVLKNSAVTLLGEVIGGGLYFAAAVVVARALGVERFGQFTSVVAFLWILQSVVDLGLRRILIREVATDPARAGAHLGVASALLWGLSVLAVAVVAAGAALLGLPRELLHAVWLAGLSVVPVFRTAGYGALCRAFEDMEVNAVGGVLQNLLFLAGAVGAVRAGLGLRGVFAGLLLANLVTWGYYAVMVRRRYLRPRLVVDVRAAWGLLRASLPLGLGALLRKASWHVDTLLLTALAGAAAAGLYNAAYRFIHALNLLPKNLGQALFPAYARLGRRSEQALLEAHRRTLRFLSVLALPIPVALTVLADRVIGLFFDAAFAGAVPALQVLSWALVLVFPNALYANLFTALGRQGLYAASAGACLGVNLVVDLLLIPRLGVLGACLGTLAAELALFAAGTGCLRRLGFRAPLVGVSWKPALGAAGMVVVLLAVRQASLPWVALGLLGSGGLYLAGLLVLRAFSDEETLLLRALVAPGPR